MKVSLVATESEKTTADVCCFCCQSVVTIRTDYVLTTQVISQHSSLRDIASCPEAQDYINSDLSA